jgi:hypothetical protein
MTVVVLPTPPFVEQTLMTAIYCSIDLLKCANAHLIIWRFNQLPDWAYGQSVKKAFMQKNKEVKIQNTN